MLVYYFWFEVKIQMSFLKVQLFLIKIHTSMLEQIAVHFYILTRVKYNSDIIAKSTQVGAREEGRGKWG